MNKSQLIEKVALDSSINIITANSAVKSIIEAISAEIANDEKVSIQGFGSFTVGTRAARTGRNPQTGEPIQISQQNFVSFKPAKALKDSCNP